MTLPHADLEFGFVSLQFRQKPIATLPLFIISKRSENSYFPIWFRSFNIRCLQLFQGLIPVLSLSRPCCIHISPAHLFYNYGVLVHGARRVQRVLKRSLAGRSGTGASSIGCGGSRGGGVVPLSFCRRSSLLRRCAGAASIGCGGSRAGGVVPLHFCRRSSLLRRLRAWPCNILVSEEFIQLFDQTGLAPIIQYFPCPFSHHDFRNKPSFATKVIPCTLATKPTVLGCTITHPHVHLRVLKFMSRHVSSVHGLDQTAGCLS